MNNEIFSNKIDLKEFIPQKMQSGNFGHFFKTHTEELEDYYLIYYFTDVHNKLGIYKNKKKYSAIIKKIISRNLRTFEVLGLLQGEMSKTYNKTVIFSNSEPNLNREIMDWFSEELRITHNEWHWYIKVNINKPEDIAYQKFVENKVISYWLKETRINFDKRYPTTVSYIKNTVHKVLKENDYGSLIIEFKSNIISEILKNFVKRFTNDKILNCDFNEILHYMRGIIAAESCVEIHHGSKKYRIHISAVNPIEKEIFFRCLEKLGVGSKIYKYDKLVVSKKQNNFKLLELDLMSLNPNKHRKFLELINCYPEKTRNKYYIKDTSIFYNPLSSSCGQMPSFLADPQT